MPRATRKDKFFIYAPVRSGKMKGKRLYGVNHEYEGDINLQDLFDFLREYNIEPSQIKLSPGLTGYA